MKKIFNNDLSIKNVDEKLEVFGWVSKKRDLGGVIFIDLRDRSGIVQLVVNPDNPYYEVASELKSEYVLRAVGMVKERSNKNSNIATGDIEIVVSELEVLNTSCDIPFEISDDTTALEDTRLKYRYLDIRRNEVKDNLILRHKVMLAVRN